MTKNFCKNRTWSHLALLGSLLLLSLACASGKDLNPDNAPNRNQDGGIIPPYVRESFIQIPGGDFVSPGIPVNPSLFDSNDVTAVADANTAQGVPATLKVSGFYMMKTEVTVQMYAEYLNQAARIIVANPTSSVTGGSVGFHANYRNVMSDQNFVGIFPVSSTGGRVPVTIDTYSGITAKPYMDPRQVPVGSLEKNRQAASAQYFTFSVEPGRSTYPIVFVSMNDAKTFANWLGSSYRLPTWVEWQWAAKGGYDVDFPSGDSPLGEADLPLGNFQGNFTSYNSSFAVGSYQPNGFGLYDMMGNVYEWTQKEHEDSTTGSSSARYVLGGSYRTQHMVLLSTWYRHFGLSPDAWASDVGFRLVFDVGRPTSFDSLITP